MCVYCGVSKRGACHHFFFCACLCVCVCVCVCVCELTWVCACDGPSAGFSGGGGFRELEEFVEEELHAEIGHGGTEEHGRLLALCVCVCVCVCDFCMSGWLCPCSECPCVCGF